MCSYHTTISDDIAQYTVQKWLSSTPAKVLLQKNQLK